jgi:hypothetical protein
MHVTYFDEVKADPKQGQDAYWVGGICVKMDHIAGLEAQVNSLSQELFNSVALTKATEFHAKCLYFGHFPFKGWKPDKRLEVLIRLIDIIAQPNVIRRVYACVQGHPDRLRLSNRRATQ